MNDPKNIDELEEASGMSLEDILSLIEEEMENQQDGYQPLQFDDDDFTAYYD